jgi:anti-sigma-K factor RskA
MTDGPRSRSQPLRRQDDKRFDDLSVKVDVIDRRTQEIRDMLISEPEQSPMGRSLIRKSDSNARRIAEQEERVDKLWDFMVEWRGAGRVLTVAAAVMSIVAAAVALASWIKA